MLGNPVDVAFDEETRTIFIAEAANGGGRVGFSNSDYEAGGDVNHQLIIFQLAIFTKKTNCNN